MKLQAIISVLAFIQSVTAAVWYVDNAATGARNGSSWADAYTNIYRSSYAAGDTVYISGGTVSKTYHDAEFTPKGGTAGNPVTYKIGQDAGHNGLAIFDGTAAGSTAFLYGAAKNVVWSGDYQGQTRFMITNVSTTPVHLDDSSDVWLDHMIVNGVVRFNPGTNITLSHLTIRGRALSSANIIWEVRRPAGAELSFTNNTIRNCTILMACNSNTPSWGSDGIAGGNCSSVYSNRFDSWYYIDGTEAEEGRHADGWQNLGNSWCRVYANRFENIANYGVFWEPTGSLSNVWIYNNVFYNNDTFSHANQAAEGIVFGQRTAGSTIEAIVVANNTFVDWFGRTAWDVSEDSGEVSTWRGCIIANNLSYNSGKAGSYVAGILDRVSSATNGVAMLNNKAISGIRGTNTITPAQLQTAGGDDNLQMVSYSELSDSNDARLLSTDTAAINLGVDLSAYFTTDADGNTRSGTWDLGAYEYQSSFPAFNAFSLSPGVTLRNGVTLRP